MNTQVWKNIKESEAIEAALKTFLATDNEVWTEIIDYTMEEWDIRFSRFDTCDTYEDEDINWLVHNVAEVALNVSCDMFHLVLLVEESYLVNFYFEASEEQILEAIKAATACAIAGNEEMAKEKVA